MFLGTPSPWLLTLVTAAALFAPASPASAPPAKNPDTIVILSTTDVKGKTSPCGCHIPKGGLSRQASFADSIRLEYANVVIVDNGGFFPEDATHREFASFLMEQMPKLGVVAAGVGDRDLRFGAAFLKAEQKRTGFRLLSANLIEKSTKKTMLPASWIQPVGAAKIGYFSLISDKVDLGPARDSLAAQEPVQVARRVVADLRARGATVVVLLSQLGKVESEDLVSVVDGIDAVIVGRNVPMVQKGRMVKNTIACYGGEQGQYYGRTLITVDAKGAPTLRDCETFMLGPEVGERPDVQKLVKDFEDRFNEAQRKVAMETAASKTAVNAENSTERYVGNEVCSRCHVAEATQWQGTKHAQAWKTLVDEKKESTPDCVPCHVVGYKKPGGFQGGATPQHLVNVGCENCHGMGSNHEAMAAKPMKVSEATCVECHTSNTSPEFSFATYLPHVMHSRTGELPALPARKTSKKMMGASGH